MLNHKGTQEIKTERLLLRRFKVRDAEDMFKNWANDERVSRYVGWSPHKSPKFTKKLLRRWRSAYRKKNNYNWAIEFEGKVIGSISVVKINNTSEYAELGYCLGFDFWNKGIMSEAAEAVIDFLFSEVGVHNVGIWHAVKNPASGRVAQKCGLTYEGTRRELFKTSDGRFNDIACYGILKDEWEERRQATQN